MESPGTGRQIPDGGPFRPVPGLILLPQPSQCSRAGLPSFALKGCRRTTPPDLLIGQGRGRNLAGEQLLQGRQAAFQPLDLFGLLLYLLMLLLQFV